MPAPAACRLPWPTPCAAAAIPASWWADPSTAFCARLDPKQALDLARSGGPAVQDWPCMAGGAVAPSPAKHLALFAVNDAGSKDVARWSGVVPRTSVAPPPPPSPPPAPPAPPPPPAPAVPAWQSSPCAADTASSFYRARTLVDQAAQYQPPSGYTGSFGQLATNATAWTDLSAYVSFATPYTDAAPMYLNSDPAQTACIWWTGNSQQ